MSNTDSLASITLRPWPAPAKDALSKEKLSTQIHQLTVERGNLRGITEQALQAEIDAGKSLPEDGIEGAESESKKDGPAPEEKMEELWKKRIEMYEKLEWAGFSAGNALNLVSLVLTKWQTGKSVENGFTPQFREMRVPDKSFGLDRSEEAETEKNVARWEDEAKRRVLVMKGSRMQAFDWATDSLLKAATELENGIRKETKYWHEILSIAEKGWPIQRTRRDARTAPFAVRYGLPEASNHFKARGLAPLRMNKEGGIILDSKLSLKPKTMRVRVSDNDEIVGTSHLPPRGGLDELAIEQSIQLARDSVFEEELFHELSLESRDLRAHGVELRDSVISIPVSALGIQSSRRKLLIDCTARDDSLSTGRSRPQDHLAQNVAEGLRLLLAHEHRLRLHRRSQNPPALSQSKRLQSGPPLLRTLLRFSSHIAATNDLHHYLHRVERTLKSAGLAATLDTSREDSWVKLTEILENDHMTNLSAIDRLVASFTQPYKGVAMISLPSTSGKQVENIEITTQTFVGKFTLSAEHLVVLPPSLVKVLELDPDQPRQFVFSTAEEVQSYIDWLLTLDISRSFMAKEYMGRAHSKTQAPSVSILSEGKTKGLEKEEQVSVVLENGLLTISAAAEPAAESFLETGTAGETFIWDGTPGRATLVGKVRSWIK